jgi:hypothetical protein
MSFMQRSSLRLLSLLAALPKPIPVGTVTGHISSHDAPFEEVPAITQTTDVPADQQVLNEPLFVPLEQDYSKLKVSSKMAAAWNKLKPSSLTADDVARLDAAQQKRDRKAANRAADRVRTLDHWRNMQGGYGRPLGDHNAYSVH